MPGKFVHGALVELTQTFLLPVPNVIIFQYNPETMTHTWAQPEAAPPRGGMARSNPLAVRGMPGESFSFTLAMDAYDMIADGSPVAQGIAAGSGIYTRLAALEMLMYPIPASGPGLVGSVSARASLTGSAALFGQSRRRVPDLRVPTVLFVWGAGRVVPVRVTELTITEKLYDQFLNPTHAEATLGLRVLTPEELSAERDALAPVARGAYLYSQGLRQTLATANLANAAESIIGMLPI
jgi:hypothetical protein